MNIYKISQDENYGYDTYDAAIVIAEKETEARKILPGGESDKWEDNGQVTGWASDPKKVKVELIGKAIKSLGKGVILASFKAG